MPSVQRPLKSQNSSQMLRVHMYIVVAKRVQAGVKLKRIIRWRQRPTWNFQCQEIVEIAEKLAEFNSWRGTLPPRIPFGYAPVSKVAVREVFECLLLT